ncbi:MAG: adenosine deaminase [Clostridiales Family XIII bacterium]|jgi:adenosine deaminase|nr:adenosine deaminase [Clostridiales Family XIII bacterium]
MADWRLDLFRAMPKVELHLHLDGAVEVKTAMELAAAASGGTSAPGAECSYETMHRRFVLDKNAANQDELLRYYDAPLALLQSREALERVTEELLRRKAADGLRYCEIRWAPRLHLRGGLSLREAVESVLRAKNRECRRSGIRAGLILVGMRGETPEANVDMLRQAAAVRTAGDGLAAVDLAGREEANPDPAVQKPFFDEARRLGFGVTLHCGELPGSAGAVRRAVETVAPDRIAHGSGAAADLALCRLLRERGIQLDLCPNSNIQAGLYRDFSDFPLAELYHRGVPVSISTDSPVISGLSLSEEYYRLALAGGLTPAELWQVNLRAVARIFAPEAVKRELTESFLAWARGISELAGGRDGGEIGLRVEDKGRA